MPSQSRLDVQFAFTAGTPILPNLQRVLTAIESRFQALEIQRASFDDAIARISNSGLDRITQIIDAMGARLAELASTSMTFVARSDTPNVQVGLGIKQLSVSAADRTSFIPSQYLAVIDTSNQKTAMAGSLIAYNHVTGELAINVFQASAGEDVPDVSNWVICAAAPPMVPSLIDGGTFEGGLAAYDVIPYVTDLFAGVNVADGGLY